MKIYCYLLVLLLCACKDGKPKLTEPAKVIPFQKTSYFPHAKHSNFDCKTCHKELKAKTLSKKVSTKTCFRCHTAVEMEVTNTLDSIEQICLEILKDTVSSKKKQLKKLENTKKKSACLYIQNPKEYAAHPESNACAKCH